MSGNVIHRTQRGFQYVEFRDHNGQGCELQQSSAVGPYLDAIDAPGSSYVWLGLPDHRMHLSREQVAELIGHLSMWLAAGWFGDDRGEARGEMVVNG